MKETLIFNFFIGEKTMPQTVQISVTLNIKSTTPPPNPLVASPSSVTLPDMTVGTAVSAVPVSVVSLGTPPYSQPVLDPASPAPIPPGLSAATDASGNVTISGTPSASGSGTFILDVSDSSV